MVDGRAKSLIVVEGRVPSFFFFFFLGGGRVEGGVFLVTQFRVTPSERRYPRASAILQVYLST